MKIFRATVEDAMWQIQGLSRSRFFERGTSPIKALFTPLKGTENSIPLIEGQSL